jgi:DHA1 family bicyclomycin/chloramphenicol resistance-like MFS transporter
LTGRIRPGSPAFIALIAAFMTMTAMTIDINLPAIPLTAVDLGTSLTTAQLSVPLFFVGFALGQLVWGPASDRFGRKPAMLVGTAVFILTTIGCALSGSIETMLATRVVQGFGAGAGAVLGRAVIRDLFEGQQMARILSLAIAAFITAPIVAPSIGAVILGVSGSWRAIFVFLALYGLVLLLLAWLFLDESLPHKNPAALDPGRILAAFAAVFRNPESLPAALIVILIFGTLTLYLTNAAAVFMDGYAMDPTTFGVAFAVVAVFSALGSVLNSRLVKGTPLATVIRYGLIGGLFTGTLTLLIAWTGIGGRWAVVVGFALFFINFGLVAANSTALALQPHGGIAGSAAAVLGFSQTVIPAIFASLVAAAYDGTAIPLLIATVALVLLGLVALRRVPTPAPA